MSFYDKNKLLESDIKVKIVPRGWGRLTFVLNQVEKLYSEAWQTETNSTEQRAKNEGKKEAYREVINLLKAVLK